MTFPPRPRLLALDLDGTLLGSDQRASPRTRAALTRLREAGVVVLICTGRPRRTATPVLQELALGDAAALYNGALLWDVANAKVLKAFLLEPTALKAALVALRRRWPGVAAAAELVDGWYADPAYHRYRTLQSEKLTEPTAVGDLSELVTEPAIKLLVRHETVPAAELATALDGLPVHATWAFPSLLEVSAAGVTKAGALRWLCERLDIPAAQVAAFGDQHNDKEMLAWAGFGVAMGNASPEAKAAADFVTASCDEDGVAAVLEHWLP